MWMFRQIVYQNAKVLNFAAAGEGVFGGTVNKVGFTRDIAKPEATAVYQRIGGVNPHAGDDECFAGKSGFACGRPDDGFKAFSVFEQGGKHAVQLFGIGAFKCGGNVGKRTFFAGGQIQHGCQTARTVLIVFAFIYGMGQIAVFGGI